MNDIYSPATGEHIRTDNPAFWMGRAGTPAPDYDPATAGCFWCGDRWEVVPAVDALPPMPDARRTEIIAALGAIDAASIRPAREIAAAMAGGKDAPKYAIDKLSSLEEEAEVLRAELSELPRQ